MLIVGRFRDHLTLRKIPTTIRQSFGLDIDAACGQLYQVAQKELAKYNQDRKMMKVSAA